MKHCIHKDSYHVVVYITTDNKFNMAITSFGGIIASNRDDYSLTIDL